MKKNTFYLLIGCIAFALLAILWYSVETRQPFLIEGAFIAGIVLVYLARRRVEDIIEDERSVKISEMAVVRTFQVFWVVFFAFSIGAVMEILHVPEFPRQFHSRTPSRDPAAQAPGIHPAGPPLPDDLPLRRLPDLLCPEVRGVGDR